MPVITILGPQNQGVDMSGEPLALGPQQIRSAVNCAVRKGVIGNRPSFTYHKLGIKGCFQGATGYAPAYGISAASFAGRSASLVICAGGKLYRSTLDCAPQLIPAQDFGKGSVHLFQAENWLIAQSPGRNTHWWDGKGPATPSPGMEPESQWTDPDVPVTRVCPVMPEADIPDCDKFPCDGGECTVVIENITLTDAAHGSFTVTNSGTQDVVVSAFDPQMSYGFLTFDPPNFTVLAGTSLGVQFVASPGVDLGVTQITVNMPNTCGNATFVIGGTTPPGECELEITSVAGLSNTTAQVVIQNTGSSDISTINIASTDSLAWAFDPLPPYALGVGQSLAIGVDGLGTSLGNRQFSITSNCAATVSGVIPVTTDPVECALTIVSATLSSATSGSITIENTGSDPVHDIHVVAHNGDWTGTPDMFSLDPGDTQVVTFSSMSDVRLTQFDVFSDCAEPILLYNLPDYP